MITRATIDKIFSAVRVEDIVGEFVQLKRAGANLKGLSPFRDEKTPSFVVSPSKQIWKDFSTGKGGNAITFLMELESFTYPEALRYIAKKYGIEIEENLRELSEEEKQKQTDKELLYKIHEIANDFFQEQMWNTEEGQTIGLSYFRERGLNDSILKKFQLGYSPAFKSSFTQFALEKGYTKEILAKSGLSIFREETGEGIDRFRERVIFPIHTFSGRTIAFGGRILNSNLKTAKYLNSPETDIYHKSNVLYGLNQSKQAISKTNQCLLVEGYMDVVSLHQSGIENVVASSGTALTPEQIKLIKRLTENVTLLFDGDEAGIKASFRSIDLLLDQGMNVRILLFPDGDDPDSFAKKHPADFVQKYIAEHAQDFIDFKANVLLSNVQHDPIKKAAAIRDIIQSVAHVSNPLKQEVYIQEISSKFGGLNEQNLFNELKNIQQSQERKIDKTPATPHHSSTLTVEKIDTSVDSTLFLEEKLIEILLKYGEYIIERKDIENQSYETTVLEEILAHFEEDDYEIRSPINEKIIAEMKEGIAKNEIRGGNFFSNYMEEDLSQKIADALVEPYHTSNWEKFNISFHHEEEILDRIVFEACTRHKRAYILQLINEEKEKLKTAENHDEHYKKILLLTQLKIQLDKSLYRAV